MFSLLFPLYLLRNDWTCHRCIVDSQEAARRHHYHARSSFALRSASSTTSFGLSTSSTVGFSTRPSSAMGYSVSSSSTDKTQATHLIPCSFPQCEVPSVNIFCAQHLKSFPVPVPFDRATSTSQRPDTAATSGKRSVQRSSSFRSTTTSHSVGDQTGAGNPARVYGETEAPEATASRKRLENQTLSPPVADGDRNSTSPFSIRKSKLLQGNFVRRKTAGKNPYLNGRTPPKPGPGTDKRSTSLTQNLDSKSAGSATVRPNVLSSTTNTSSLTPSNGGPQNKRSSSSSSFKRVDGNRSNVFESHDRPQPETSHGGSTKGANMAIDASCLSTQKQPLGERQNGAAQPSNQGVQPRRIAEFARQLGFSGEMQDAACNGSAVHAAQQPVQGPTPTMNQTAQNSLRTGAHQHTMSRGTTNLQVIMPTGQSSNYMSMADRLAVHYAKSAADLGGGYAHPTGLIQRSTSTQSSANGIASRPTEPLSNVHGQYLQHQSGFPSNPDQTAGPPRQLPPQKPQQPQPAPRAIVTNVHEPIVISDSESDSEEHSEHHQREGLTHPPEPAAQQQSQERRTVSEQRPTSQQKQPSRESVPPGTVSEPVPQPVSGAQHRPQAIPQPIFEPASQSNSHQEANPAPPPIPDEPLFLHIDPRVHWPQRHSKEWFETKQKEIQARGGRKANFGKAARSMHRQLMAEGPPETLEETLPDKILDNPAWVNMLKRLRDTKPAVESEKGKGKGKETAGAVTAVTKSTSATGMSTKGRRKGGGLKRTLSNASTGATANGSKSAAPAEASDKAVTTPNAKRRAAGAGLRRVLSNASAGLSP
ncbi:hypothetical protein B0T20DRAFT_456469 [Sordaria brevicollis]|uniref:Uncharacterized protein n=1 Tax=Sordaria brevicollis TaxID=83679 RepID=A0AAE0P2A6_SORBR|nr:hypothetical protein B0T20DRAFT_456469 [Sordaria brevicollis]